MSVRSGALWLLASTALLACPPRAAAQDVESPAIIWLGAAVLVADVTLSAGNAIALTAGTSTRGMGMVGAVTGVTTLGMVALNYALTEDEQLRDEFGIVAGTLGVLSTTLGILALRSSSPRDDHVEQNGFTLRPTLLRGPEAEWRLGIALRQRF